MTGKKTRTWRMMKIRKEKVVKRGRGGIMDFMAAKPLSSLPTGQVRTLGDNRVGWIAKLRGRGPPKVRVCAMVRCSACYAFCACRKSATKSASRTPCCSFCTLCAFCVCCLRCARAACNEATRAACIVPRGALPDRNVPSVDNRIYETSVFSTTVRCGIVAPGH